MESPPRFVYPCSVKVPTVEVIGAGLAGCEAALQCARRGVPVRLYEMRPGRQTEAHRTGDVAELVCSNSLKSDEPHNAHGLLKAELRLLGSVLLDCGARARIPGGKALVVDRARFSAEVEAVLDEAGIEVIRQEVTRLPEGTTVLATGPLTSPGLAGAVAGLLGSERLFFYDAIAPIVGGDSVDRAVAFPGSRYGEPDGTGDYLNCPMDEEQYEAFVDALLGAELHPADAWDTIPDRTGTRSGFPRTESRSCPQPAEGFGHVPLFEGCLPVEELARRGRDTLAFGPMKPVGLVDPRTGRRPHAVVQLRRENAAGTMYNLVGFQTRLRQGEQRRVFGMIPGLERAEFLRFGSIHRNSYLDSPRVLRPTLQTRQRADLLVAGQLTGVEGYVESIGAGLVAGLNAARLARGEEPVVPPGETMTGSLLCYVAPGQGTGGHDPVFPDGNRSCPRSDDSGHVPFRFQPMNANFGLLPPATRAKSKPERRRLMAERALAAVRDFAGRL